MPNSSPPVAPPGPDDPHGAPVPAGAPAPRRRLAHAAGLVSFGTFLSRILGLVREQLFAVLFGATAVADAFVVAFRIPNLLRDLFAEGALSSAFVPTFTDHLHNRSREEAYRLANTLTTTLTAILAAIVVVAFGFADVIVSGMAAGFADTPGKQELATTLTRIMLPFLPTVSLAAVAMGMLNAQGHFFVPAFAPACFNVVSIVVGFGLWLAGFDPRVAVAGWAVGTLLGGLAQFLVQVPALRAEGWRFRPRLDLAFRDPGMRRIALLMGPATVGLAATQVNIFVNTIFASHEAGAAAWLNFAFRLMQLPLGLFGVAVGTIATAALARRAAERDAEGLRRTLVQALRLGAFLSIPATLGLVALARPIVRLIYEHGRFHAGDTEATASALTLYAIGLAAHSSVKVLAPSFYALDKARVPLLASVGAVAANLLFNATLYPVLGYRGLALGTSIAALVNVAVLGAAFQRLYGGLLSADLWGGLGRMLAAALPMGLVAYGADVLLERALGTDGLGVRLAGTLIPVALGGAVYAGLAAALRLPEATEFLGILRRRLGP